MDLYLALGPRPRRADLERELRTGIRQGRLRPGTALPSSRALAAELEISRGTVVEAYAQLVAEGWLTARQGAATLVASAVPAIPDPSPLRVSSSNPDRSADPRCDLRTGRPDLSKFPRRAWGQAMLSAIRRAPDAVLDYGDPRGLQALRDALVDHLGRTRGVVTQPGRVVICSGTSAGLPLLWRALRRHRVTAVAVEDPSWFEHAQTARASGLMVVPIPVDGDGLVVEELVAREVGAVLTTPAHQFPTGVVLAPERRAALVEWARQTGGLIVEDDYDAEFRYDREPIGAVQGLAPDHVAYIGTVSKTLAPALRCGWLVLPEALAEPVAEEAGYGSAIFEQLALAAMIDNGDLGRHLRRMRRTYRLRRDALERALAGRLHITGVAAGLHLMAVTDDADMIASRAAAHGVAVETLEEMCTVKRPHRPALLLGYAREPEAALSRAVELMLAR